MIHTDGTSTIANGAGDEFARDRFVTDTDKALVKLNECLSISFDSEASESFATFANGLKGYNVELTLHDGDTVDARLLDVHSDEWYDEVTYRAIDEDGDPTGPVLQGRVTNIKVY